MNARYSSNGDLGVGAQLFMARSREPQAGYWKCGWRPMATMGAISARAFLDTGTLDDPQWVSGLLGVRVLPRPGNAEVELVNDAGTVVATCAFRRRSCCDWALRQTGRELWRWRSTAVF